MVMLFTIEPICICEMVSNHVTCSLKNPGHSPGALCSNNSNYEGKIVVSSPPFLEIPRAPFQSFELFFAWLFPDIDRI